MQRTIESLLITALGGKLNTVIRISLFYFVLVFSAGFVFGSIRVLLLAGFLGEANAELLEMPLMVIVCAFAARFLIFKNSEELTILSSILIGLIALAVLIFVEISVVLWLRKLTLSEYLSTRVSLAGLAYLIGLVWYAVAPSVFYWVRSRRAS